MGDTVSAKRKAKNERQINYDQFVKCLVDIAAKRGEAVDVVFDKASEAEFQLHGTKADHVRLNDDESTFTGSHATDGRHAGDGDGHIRVHDMSKVDHSTDTTDWDSIRDVYNEYLGRDSHMDSKCFAKLMTDSGIITTRGEVNEIDLCFIKACPKSHLMDFDLFKEACRFVGNKKGVPYEDIRQQIAACAGPQLHATQAQKNKFHDDKSLYTGSHVGKP